MSRLARHGLLTALLLMVCGAANAQSTADASAAAAGKPLVVGVRANPPFVIRDDAGQYHGIAIDLWNGVAKALGRTAV